MANLFTAVSAEQQEIVAGGGVIDLLEDITSIVSGGTFGFQSVTETNQTGVITGQSFETSKNLTEMIKNFSIKAGSEE